MAEAPISSREERRLVASAKRGSVEAVEELFRRHWSRLHRAAYLVVQDAAAAEDIAQEAFLAAIRSLDRFDRRRPLGPWLHRIAVNRAIDAVRARTLRREVGGQALDSMNPPQRDRAGEPKSEATRALSDETTGALAALPVEQRAVVVMRHLLDYTPGEIARALELPRGTVNSRLRRGLDQLGAELEEER